MSDSEDRRYEALERAELHEMTLDRKNDEIAKLETQQGKLLLALERCETALQAAHYGVVGTTLDSRGVTKEEVSHITFAALQKARALITRVRGGETAEVGSKTTAEDDLFHVLDILIYELDNEPETILFFRAAKALETARTLRDKLQGEET